MKLTPTRNRMAALILLAVAFATLTFIPRWGARQGRNRRSVAEHSVAEHNVSNLQVDEQERILDFPDNMDQERNRNVPIKFHLPEETSAQPMVVVSHGAGGSRDGLFALSQELANQGYVLMCLEHVTSNLDNISSRMRSKRLGFRDALVDCGKDMSARKNRPLDVKFAIDLAERFNREETDLKGRIDFSQIAMIGHSYGAYTTMVCCGAKPVDIELSLIHI